MRRPEFGAMLLSHLLTAAAGFLSWNGAPGIVGGTGTVQPGTQGIYDKRRPLVLWHGLGDNYNSSAMRGVVDIFNQIHPTIYIHSVHVDADPQKDEQASYFGDMNREIDTVCEQIRTTKHLKDGFDAIGFSQGGVFMRGLVERCEHAKVHNLITFGAPHMGVMDLPACADPDDWLCRRRNDVLKRQIWWPSVQTSVVPAQYFRDPFDYQNYLFHSNFLVDANNEKAGAVNTTYISRMKQLNKFVMVMFNDDTTVVPKESSQFFDVDPVHSTLVPFRYTKIYTNDLLGLRWLHEHDRIDFYDLDGEHMRIPETFLVEIANVYLAGKV